MTIFVNVHVVFFIFPFNKANLSRDGLPNFYAALPVGGCITDCTPSVCHSVSMSCVCTWLRNESL